MDSLITTISDLSVTKTVHRMIEQIEKEGWHLFAYIDHTKEAREIGLNLRPTELLLIGNPEVGTLLMQNQQISAIDLPMKVLVWEDENSQVHITRNDLRWLKKRHGLTDDETICKISSVIDKICLSASSLEKRSDEKDDDGEYFDLLAYT